MGSTDESEIAATLRQLGSATLGESGGLATDRRLKPVWAGAVVAAPAYTVQCTPGDNLAVHVGVTTAPAGSVLVVNVGQVIDGGVRDVAALEARGFPVFSAAIALTGATKASPGTVGAPISVGGVSVATGDWVVGDVDGVAVIPSGQLEAVIAAGQARETKEAGFFAALRAGATTVELLELDAALIARS